MKSKMKRRMLAIVLCMVIVLSNSSFIFASSESGTPAVEAASTEGTTSQTETDTQVTETTPQTLAVSESIPAPTDEPAAPTSVEATPTPTDTPEAATIPEPTGTPTPEATPTPTDTPETTTAPQPTDTPEMTPAPEPTETPEAAPAPTQVPEDGTSDTAQPTAAPTPTEAPVKSNEAVELKQEFKDSDGNVTSTVTAQIPEGTFAADTSEITMEVRTPDTASAEHVKEMMEELLPENHMLGDYIFYDIQFKVNGTVTEPQKPIAITFEGNELSVKDVKRANVFWLDPEDPQVEGDKDELVEITQKSEMLEYLQASGQSTEHIDDYDLSEITLKEDGTSDKIQMEGRTSTIYGCYVVYEPVQVLTYDDDQVTVTVSAAEEGIIPANAELKVVPITAEDKNTEEQYKEVEQKLQEKAEEDAYDIAGFLAYDITFVDEDGNETEPGGEVKVSIDYKEAAIPEAVSEEDAANAEVTVLHLEEDEKGEVKEVVDMAQNEKVDVLATTEENKIEKAEVRTESFSTFVIQWKYGNDYGEYFTINAYYFYEDTNGDIVKIPDSEMPKHEESWSEILNSEKNRIDLSDTKYEISISGYTHLRTVADDKNSTQIITYLEKGSDIGYLGNTYYYIAHDNDKNWLSNRVISYDVEGDIYFIYQKDQKENNLEIVDNIIEGGDLQAKYTPTDGKTVEEYQWFRSDSESGEYTEVENVYFTSGDSVISEDGTSLYPAFDEGARKWYKVKVTFSDGTELESSPIQVKYYDELQNGSFEKPNYRDDNNTMTWVSNEEYAAEGIWQTTGEDPGTGNNDIEILSAETSGARKKLKADYWWTDANSPQAYEGYQFAELNAQAPGALYQDVLTMKGQLLNYSLAHRARGNNPDDFYGLTSTTLEYDSMYVVIVPTSLAMNGLNNDGDEIDEQEEVLDLIERKDEFSGVYVQEYTSSDQAWKVYSDTYTPTSSLTRFFFVAGETAYDERHPYDTLKGTVGNFLDNVSFSQDPPKVAEDEFNVVINKKFEGLDATGIDSVKENIQFKISAKNQNGDETDVGKIFGSDIIHGDEMHQNPDGSLQIDFLKVKINPNEQYVVTIEEIGADLDGYKMTSEVETTVQEGDADPVTKNEATFTLKGQVSAEVTFTNTYDPRENKTVTFTKVWDDKNNEYGTRPENLQVTLNASCYVNENGTMVEKELSGEDLGGVELTQTMSGGNALSEDNNKWQISWDVPIYYDYNGAKVKINYTVTEGNIDSEYVYESTSEAALEGDGSDYAYQNNDLIVQEPDQNSQNMAASSKLSAVNAMTYNANSNEDDGLGEPAHNKYIEYNQATGEYTLNLDITGAAGEATGVDVLFVIDTSGSMGSGWGNNNLLPDVKDLLVGDDQGKGIIDQIFEAEGNVNSVAYVAFAGKGETKTSRWYSGSEYDINRLKNGINALRATGGTNWTYAMQTASDLLEQRSNNSNEKVVIFLSDGEPTYTIDEWGRQEGSGSSTRDYYYEDAAKVVNNSSSLKEAKIYSIYLTENTKGGMEKFDQELDQGIDCELKNGENLGFALSEILKIIIPEYTNVTITDVLSSCVDFIGDKDDVTVTKRTADGNTTSLVSESEYTADISGKVITVTLLGGQALEDGAKYTVSFKVKPSKTAEENYASMGGYTDIGDPGTGSTSADQKGFYSNDSAKVEYTVNGNADESEYPKPVVQVTTHVLEYEKVWNHPLDVLEPTDDVELTVYYTDGTKGSVTLTANEGYHKEETVPVTKKIASVEETSVFEDYEPSYQLSEDRTSVQVINNYSKITTTTIKVRKKWEGGETERTPIRVALFRSVNGGTAEQVGDAKEISETTSWECVWNNLIVKDPAKNENYSYAVREVDTPTHFRSSISYKYQSEELTVATITNTYDPNAAEENYYIANVLQTDKVTINKTWDDNDNALGERPETLGVTVSKAGKNYTVSLNGNSSTWQKNITLLKTRTGNYTAEESSNLGNYKQISSEVVETETGAVIYFTNKLDSLTVKVKKTWNDGEIDTRPESIGFKLQYRSKDSVDESDWQVYGGEDNEYWLSKENITDEEPWTIEFSNLSANYEYRVIETSVSSGYHGTVAPMLASAETGNEIIFTITNTLTWGAKKTNSNGDAPLGGATFDLKKSDGTVIARGSSGEDGMITWTPEQGITADELQKLNGTYTICETSAPSGYYKSDGEWNVEFDKGLLTKLDGAEVKGTAQDGVIITLKNDIVYDLPSAGGPGIFWYLMGGTMLMMAGSFILYRMKRKEVQES